MAHQKQGVRKTGRQLQTGFAHSRRKPDRQGPPALMDVLEWLDDGEGRTRADTIIEAVRHNVPLAQAARTAGLVPHTLHAWLREGADVAASRAAMVTNDAMYKRPSRREEALWWFWQQIDQAQADAEARLARALDARATGELTAAVITRELQPRLDAKGNVVLGDDGKPVMVESKRTEKRNKVLPDSSAIAMLLKTRYPERWAGTDKLEVTGSGGAPIEHRVVHTVDGMESLLEKVAARITNPIDTSASEIPPLTDG